MVSSFSHLFLALSREERGERRSERWGKEEIGKKTSHEEERDEKEESREKREGKPLSQGGKTEKSKNERREKQKHEGKMKPKALGQIPKTQETVFRRLQCISDCRSSREELLEQDKKSVDFRKNRTEQCLLTSVVEASRLFDWSTASSCSSCRRNDWMFSLSSFSSALLSESINETTKEGIQRRVFLLRALVSALVWCVFLVSAQCHFDYSLLPSFCPVCLDLNFFPCIASVLIFYQEATSLFSIWFASRFQLQTVKSDGKFQVSSLLLVFLVVPLCYFGFCDS